ncbi:hypothetical protein F2Q69_00016834 [Brassica cretica]|uniref:Uncharacterized protein n=1 Tax=Brassica cretica TaxID=69181 RepID=A0A8S9R7D3_BRACR|nr:hypothetical protein F2Q69_00016834 [Brassica cretica]
MNVKVNNISKFSPSRRCLRHCRRHHSPPSSSSPLSSSPSPLCHSISSSFNFVFQHLCIFKVFEIWLNCVCGEWSFKENFKWEFVVDKNKTSSFINFEEDLQYEDLLKIVSEDFLIQAEGITLSYEISLEFKGTVEDVPPISIGNTRQLRSFIDKIRVLPDLASSNRQIIDTCASPVPLNYIPNFGSTVQREQHVRELESSRIARCG